MAAKHEPDLDHLDQLIKALPKVELHLHIEGTLEPELMFALAERNGVTLPFATVEDLRRAYDFKDLQSFLDLYYKGMQVLLTERDFFDLTWAYLERVAADNAKHVEIFFDPQAHTNRRIPFETVISGIHEALVQGQEKLHLSSRLILCFLRDLSPEAANGTLTQALRFREWITGVGLDSAEAGYPPELFRDVFDRARAEGFVTVAHAGEEGPAAYIRQALDLLRVARIDHGVRCLEDEDLVQYLAQHRIPLTVCPLSNVKLRVFPTLEAHNLKTLLHRGLCVSIHSDDPAYFGGYITANYLAARRALGLDLADIAQLARNGVEASFLPTEEKQRLFEEITELVDAPQAGK